jgi:ferredoxin-NADP reductase
MEKFVVRVIKTEYVTHDVKRIVVEKPGGYSFSPGQATDVSINTEELKNEVRPFTCTGLNKWDFLEFTIKIYRDHNGVTKQIEKLKAGDELLISEPWGAINYKGKGVFIAGGAGITPFIAIFRQLHSERKAEGNTLIYSNKTFEDIILREELSKILGDKFYNILTRQHVVGFFDKRIDESLLIDIVKDFDQLFYVCGPDMFVTEISNQLSVLGAKADAVVIEK